VPCFQSKNMNFRRAAQQSWSVGCTTELASGLHKRAGQWASQQRGPVGCTKGRAGGLQKLAGRRAAEQSGLQKKGGPHINACWRAAEKGGPFDTRADCVKNYYFSQLKTFIALYKMADRSMEGWTALNIIEIATFRCSSRCATWMAVR